MKARFLKLSCFNFEAALKTYFKEEMNNERFDYYLLNEFKNEKETAQSQKKSMLNNFLNAITKSCIKKY